MEEDARDRAPFSNNNGYAPAGEERGEEFDGGGGAEAGPAGAAAAERAEPDNELLEDNDSIEYDEDEWGTQSGTALVEEDYIDDDTDSNTD